MSRRSAALPSTEKLDIDSEPQTHEATPMAVMRTRRRLFKEILLIMFSL